MTSTLAELHEIRDYMAKLDAWSKRINGRLAMQERRSNPAASEELSPELARIRDKQALRRAVGMVPGRAAPHRE